MSRSWPRRVIKMDSIFSTDCFWENTAGASTKKRKEQRAPQICLKRWASRHSWKCCFSTTVLGSQQQRGKNCMVPSGSIWRRQISESASQGEMVKGWCWKGFLVFCVYLLVSVGCCPSSDLHRFVKLSYELELTCNDLYGPLWVWMIYLRLSLSQRVFDRLFLRKHCRCFNEETQGAEGAADLLEALSQSTQLEELNFFHFFPGNQIPAAAWQKVRGAKWLNLKKADFRGCLAERNGWRWLKVFLFSTCIYLSLFEVVRV